VTLNWFKQSEKRISDCAYPMFIGRPGIEHWTVHWLGNTHYTTGYSDGFDRVPPHLLHVQIVCCIFWKSYLTLITRGEQCDRTNTIPMPKISFWEVWTRFHEFDLALNLILRGYFKILIQSFSLPEPTTRRWLNVGLHPPTLPGGRNRHLILPPTRPYCGWTWLDDAFQRSCRCLKNEKKNTILNFLLELKWKIKK